MEETVIDYRPEIMGNQIEIAQKRNRVLAFLIDYFIFLVVALIFGYFWGKPYEDGMGFNLTGLPAFALFLIGLFLWPLSEGIWAQTIGKRALNLQVVNDQFGKCSMGQAFGRFFLGFVDCFFLVGLIIAATNKRNKRLGDIAAGTCVIRKKNGA